MRARLESLLSAHARVDGLLDQPLLTDIEEIATATESPGTKIDRYTIVEVLGEGGFGVVYKAQQEAPIRRSVALKVIKLGMDNEQIVSRFDAERQAIALMDHPHIASVYDAGATESGRPFFVMELVDGISITDYCNKERLSIKQRLQLFVQVCRAIQHAHEKGVIHRDVKPSNVLVTRKDNTPFPKVIDFGIATVAADVSSCEFDSPCAGTPAYMSPEQVTLGKAHVDLRTDVYGLGVLLYELITGRTPHVCLESDIGISINEVRRRIERDDPLAPSDTIRRMSSDKVAELAHQRQTDPGRLVSNCRRDLDCIAIKALRRQPRQRYDSVLDLARDVERLMRNEPIDARSGNIAYRTRKFIDRHRWPIISLVTMASLLFCTAMPFAYNTHNQRTAEAHRIAKNRTKIEKALVEADRLHEQSLVAGDSDLQKITQAVAAVRRAEALLDGAQDVELRQRVSGYLARLSKEESDRRFLTSIKRAQIDIVGNGSTDPKANEAALIEAFEALNINVGVDDPNHVAQILRHAQHDVRGRAVAAIDLWAGLYCSDSPERLSWLLNVARATDPDPWRANMRNAVEKLDKQALESLAADPALADQSSSCFIVLIHALQRAKSKQFFDVLHRATDTHPNVLFFNTVLGNFYSQRAGSFDTEAAQKSIRYLSAAIALRPNEPRILNNLGMNLSRVGDHEQAFRVLEKATVTQPDFWYAWHNLGLTALKLDDYDSATDAFHQSIRLLPTIASRQPVEKLLQRTLTNQYAADVLDKCDSVFDSNEWSYSTKKPTAGSSGESPDNDESTAIPNVADTADWQQGPSSFGSSFFGAETPWNSSSIWLRREVTLPTTQRCVLVVNAVAHVKVYLDGKQIADKKLTRDEPNCIPIPAQDQTETDGTRSLVVRASKIRTQQFVEVDLLYGDIDQIDADHRTRAADVAQWFRDHYNDDAASLQPLIETLDTLSQRNATSEPTSQL